jgi:nitroimidazol reductase NimA-like FMN-containing flavoprotein (pyridoxamine 5'-phosphate oxidase superfamily)
VVMANDAVYEHLSETECEALLKAGSIGRLAAIVDGRPVIFPINYVFDGVSIIFRTAAGTKLEGAGFGPVAFEVDGVDEANRSGWSVVVEGIGTEVTDAVDQHSESARRLDVQPWVPGEHAHWVSIAADSVTGRRVSRG